MDNRIFEGKKHKTLIGGLIIISFFILMFGNGMVSMTHPDEVFYMQTAKEMAANNRWFTPMIFDEVHFEKPFLSMALFTLAVKLFGLAPSVARFWPAFFGMLGVGVVYWISWLLFQSKRLSFFAGMILTSSFIYMALSRAVLTDMIFSVIVTISIGFFYQSYADRKNKSKYLILSFAFSGLAVLTKGLLGFAFPAGVILIYLLINKELVFLRTRAVLWGFIVFGIIAVPWHVAMYQSHGQWFLDEYFGNVHVRRIFDAEHRRLDNWYFYIALMFAGVLPWSLFWIPAFKSLWTNIKGKTKDSKQLIFLLSWIAGIYVFVQPAHSKLASYIFPVFPSIAIILAFYLNEILGKIEQGGSALSLRACAFVMSIVLVGVGISGSVYASRYVDVLGSMFPIYMGASLLGLVAITMFVLNLRKKYAMMLLSYMGINITLLIALFFARPYIEPWVSCKQICDVFKRIDQSDTPVLASKFYVRGIRYYTERPMAVIDINGSGFFSPHPIPFLNTEKMVIDFLDERPVTYAVVKKGNVEDLKRILFGRAYKIEELEGMGGKYILRISKI